MNSDQKWTLTLFVGMVISSLIGIFFGGAFALSLCVKDGSYKHQALSTTVYCMVKP